MNTERIALLIALLLSSAWAPAQIIGGNDPEIISWTESNSLLGLGYPVPIPVDTPEPFDGFRTHAGLHAKHQSLAMSNPNVSGHVVGQTHANRDIWAYLLSDANGVTVYGQPEGAMLINGGIHAREWQSPEVVTGVIELLAANSADQGLYQYLLENTAIVTIPVNNVDGFLQTQRYPEQNWMFSDIAFPDSSPRDGRMRRKNMRDTDEVLTTFEDHLNGIDLNRNNDPYWASSENGPNPRSSGDARSLVYRGAFAQSEPESLARIAAANLVPEDSLRIYTDMHSFSQVFFSATTVNVVRNQLQNRLLDVLTRHHAAYPAGKVYFNSPGPAQAGIGSTDEYFAENYLIPSWTLEIEPSGGSHPNLPGTGADYGGFANNGHDGFILPESQIRRVREELAASLSIGWYMQAGPPAVQQIRVVNLATEETVYWASWDWQGENARILHEQIIDVLVPGQDHALIVGFNKPMRARNAQGATAQLQGQAINLTPAISATINGTAVELELHNGAWLNQSESAWNRFLRYRDDSYRVDFRLPDDLNLNGNERIQWHIDTTDMTAQKLDAEPQTAVRWQNGGWNAYEGNPLPGQFGGVDDAYLVPLGTQSLNTHPARAGQSAVYYAPQRDGEGFSLENLPDGRSWVQWFSYDENGGQRWYFGVGQRDGNLVRIDPFMTTSGGNFNGQFDLDDVDLIPQGVLQLLFMPGQVDGDGHLSYNVHMHFTDLGGRVLQYDMAPLTQLQGLELTEQQPMPQLNDGPGRFSGSYYNAQRNGEGFIVEVLTDDRVLLQWYTYDPDGAQQWVQGVGLLSLTTNGIEVTFDDLIYTQGARFGDAFDPDDVERLPWGSATLQLQCDGGHISYTSNRAGHQSGEFDLIRLTSLEGIACN